MQMHETFGVELECQILITFHGTQQVEILEECVGRSGQRRQRPSTFGGVRLVVHENLVERLKAFRLRQNAIQTKKHGLFF